MSVLPPRPGSLRQFFLTALNKGMGKLSRHDETHKKLMIKSHYERTNGNIHAGDEQSLSFLQFL
ncbi:hypothetical protein ACO22_05887, partial [Paracoccidioides brasiliensis]